MSQIVFACYSKACAPPPAGTGGSKPGGGGGGRRRGSDAVEDALSKAQRSIGDHFTYLKGKDLESAEVGIHAISDLRRDLSQGNPIKLKSLGHTSPIVAKALAKARKQAAKAGASETEIKLIADIERDFSRNVKRTTSPAVKRAFREYDRSGGKAVRPPVWTRSGMRASA